MTNLIEPLSVWGVTENNAHTQFVFFLNSEYRAIFFARKEVFPPRNLGIDEKKV